MTNAVIVDAVRTPGGRRNGSGRRAGIKRICGIHRLRRSQAESQKVTAEDK